MIRAWRIATDTPGYTADDLTGAGAKISGGRWNRPGSPLLYCASNVSLAVLETFIHLGAGGLPLNRYLVELAIPDDVWQRAITLHAPPVGWDAIPTGKVSLDEGDRWLKANRSALMIVPSVIVQEEWNVLVNPMHPDAAAIKARKVRKWSYDPRLVRR
ncbi:RES family NAD+ phosphorylase [Herbaspirillum sp. SJZ107]|uniref:RES family NAD+ phosphorylase n=1 Tax=Herbaspirillum sp. SJZ107 TaxID=2572881 RepID=UPI00115029AC|nr:RES family NAD+ phosphorylase [Herbaspirillum sp. SJZ107]TQK07953.1 RES domain-containing protein [Herbaspirillum sp. SJZ107]